MQLRNSHLAVPNSAADSMPQVEPHFPSTIEMRLDPVTGTTHTHVQQTSERGDLLLIRNNVRQLIDLTVVRPTTVTHLTRGSADGGAHIVPLVAAGAAEKLKHAHYDQHCARLGWQMVAFAVETPGALGSEATNLLKAMSAHSKDKSPEAFLQHAHCVLSVALQSGNARVSSQGSADLLAHDYRHGCTNDFIRISNDLSGGRGPGRNHLRRTTRAKAAATVVDRRSRLASILHADYRTSRLHPVQRSELKVNTAGEDAPLHVHFDLDELQASTSHSGVLVHDRGRVTCGRAAAYASTSTAVSQPD